MYCSHCGKKVGEDMLFCPFCGKPIVIPEQDETPAPTPASAPVSDALDAWVEDGEENAAPVEAAAEAAPEPEPEAADTTTPEEDETPKPSDAAAAELLDWNRERKTRMEADVWARPEAPAEVFSPLQLDETADKLEESDWREDIAKKKQAVTLEKKPPEIKRGDDTLVRLEGTAPKLELDVQDKKPRAKPQKARKHANTLVPPKTMKPNDIFMDDRRAAYEEEDPFDSEDDELEGSFSFEDEDESSFFMRHLRGIVGLALFVILILMFVIYAFSRAGQLSLARVNVAWSKDAYSTLGYQSFQEGNYSEAGRYYERALQRDPNSYSFASSAAMAYLEAGENERAAAMLKRCAQIDPTKLEPYVYLLKLYPDAASRPWDITQLLQQGYQRTGDARLNVTG